MRLDKILNFIYFFTKTNNNLITLSYNSYSGSNSFALYRYIPTKISQKYTINFYRKNTFSLREKLRNKEYESIRDFLKSYKQLLKSLILITSHGPLLSKKKILNIELWHGFPIKAIGLTDRAEKNVDKIKTIWKNTDYFVSYSTLYSVIMSTCTGIPFDKFIITGMPRNDFLFKSNGKKNLRKLFNVENIENKKVVFFMPTFRKGYRGRKDGSKNFNNIFGFENFDEKEFLKFLDLNNIFFVAKLHPNEERFLSDKIVSKNSFCLLKNNDLEKNNIDLYELINGVDLLITDYSSVYFDYLLLDRPIIFTPVDLEDYKKSRGFLLEPYDFWTPGLKTLTQNDLQNSILRSFEKDEYKAKRNELKNVIHRYQDGESSIRVWNFIQSILKDIK